MSGEQTGVGTLTELKTAYDAKMQVIKDGMSSGAIKVDGENVEVSQEHADAMKAAYDEALQIKRYIEMGRAAEMGINILDHEPARDSLSLKQVAEALNVSHKSLGEMFTASDEFKSMMQSHAREMDTAFTLEAYDVTQWGRKDVYAAMDPGTITRTFGSIQFDPTVPRGQRPNRIRNLFPVAATTSNLIDFFQVIGFVENNASTGNNASVSGGSGNAGPVAQYVTGSPGSFGLKNKSNLKFRSNQAPVRTIAHWEAASRNVLDDEPQLQSVINNELLYGLALEEDYQILKGSGSNEDLLGIMNTEYIQVYNAQAGEIFSDTLRKAATLSILANYPSTGYVLHPNDWESVETQKGSGDGQYMLFTNIAIGAQAMVWRQPVVETAAIDEGTFLTGAFGTGAQLYDRQVANIRIAEQHGDFFVRNAVAILAEQRLALATKRPESFIKGTFAGTSAFPADENGAVAQTDNT